MTPKREQELFEKLDQLITLVRSNDARLSGVENRLLGVEDRLSGVENRLSGVEDRLSSVEAITAETRRELGEISTVVNHPNRGVAAIYDSLNNLREGVAEQRGEMRGRLEEQSRLLIALVPQKVAAVGNR